MKPIIVTTSSISEWRPVLAGQYWRYEAGEKGRGRFLFTIPCGVQDFPYDKPPENVDVNIIPRKAGGYLVVAGNDPGWLVCVRLSPGFRGFSKYIYDGEASLLGEGYEAQGAAGRAGGAPVPVFIVKGNAIIAWRRGGRLYGSPANYILYFEKEKEPVCRDLDTFLDLIDVGVMNPTVKMDKILEFFGRTTS